MKTSKGRHIPYQPNLYYDKHIEPKNQPYALEERPNRAVTDPASQSLLANQKKVSNKRHRLADSHAALRTFPKRRAKTEHVFVETLRFNANHPFSFHRAPRPLRKPHLIPHREGEVKAQSARHSKEHKPSFLPRCHLFRRVRQKGRPGKKRKRSIKVSSEKGKQAGRVFARSRKKSTSSGKTGRCAEAQGLEWSVSAGVALHPAARWLTTPIWPQEPPRKSYPFLSGFFVSSKQSRK